MVQWYVYCPTLVNVVLKLVPPACVVELEGSGAGPPVYVTLCGVSPEFHVHVTVPPVCTTMLEGLKKLLFTATAPDVGGAAAWAVNIRIGSPAVEAVAVTVCVVAEAPSVCVVVATPLALVVLCEGLTEPSSAVAGAQVTTTPGTAQLFASRAVTL